MFWKLVSRVLRKPAVLAWLKAHGERHPYTHLDGYMRRYWLVPESWGLPFAVRLHHILREDRDSVLHDHPFDFRTILLEGYYVEETVFGDLVFRPQGSTRKMSAETFHRIHSVSDGGVWTLFITTRRRIHWGFMIATPKGPRKIRWDRYESPNHRVG